MMKKVPITSTLIMFRYVKLIFYDLSNSVNFLNNENIVIFLKIC